MLATCSSLVVSTAQVKQHNKSFREGLIFRRIWFPKNAPASSEVLGIFWAGTPSGNDSWPRSLTPLHWW